MIRKRKHRKPSFLPPANPDIAVINLMNRFHSDTSKLRPIYFYLYFPTKENALAVQAELISAGFAADVNEGVTKSDWLCLATKKMVSNEKELTTLRRYFMTLTKKFNGNYDGWETEM